MAVWIHLLYCCMDAAFTIWQPLAPHSWKGKLQSELKFTSLHVFIAGVKAWQKRTFLSSLHLCGPWYQRTLLMSANLQLTFVSGRSKLCPKGCWQDREHLELQSEAKWNFSPAQSSWDRRKHTLKSVIAPSDAEECWLIKVATHSALSSSWYASPKCITLQTSSPMGVISVGVWHHR